eukprot:7302793-Lingulodinium_polyedra.AAC.1
MSQPRHDSVAIACAIGRRAQHARWDANTLDSHTLVVMCKSAIVLGQMANTNRAGFAAREPGQWMSQARGAS